MSTFYFHQERAVAFIDVLGFKGKLKEFEDEAVFHYQNYSDQEGDFESELLGVNYSKKANDFIKILDNSLKFLSVDEFRYYLFSDNICITTKEGTTKENLSELLNVVSNLYFEFASKGYFLRGGIDYGLFVDRDSIAVGVPLMNAYQIESSVANFPRIVLSENFVKQFEIYKTDNVGELEEGNIQNLILKSCEISYLNVFSRVFHLDEKTEFLTVFSDIIASKLEESKLHESVYLKFDWLAKEFNQFVDEYATNLAFLDPEEDPTQEYLETIKNLKITHAN